MNEYMYDNYTLETNNLHYFYCYWRQFCPEDKKKPSKFIQFIKEEIDIYIDIDYITDFLYQIEHEINICKGNSNKENVLKKYDDIEEFTKTLHNKLSTSIKRFLRLKTDDDEDDDEDD